MARIDAPPTGAAAPSTVAPPPPKPPRSVSRAAAAHALGAPVYAIRSKNTLREFVEVLAITAILIGLWAAITYTPVVQALNGLSGVLAVVRWVLVALAAILAIWMFSNLLLGFQQYYLYEGGVVRKRNGAPRVLPWSEIRKIEPETVLGRRAGYRLHTRVGGMLLVEAHEGDPAGDEMARRLLATYETAPKTEAAPPMTPPKRVDRVAAKHGLGKLVWATKGSNPFVMFLVCLAAAGAILGLLALIDYFGPALEQALGPLRWALAMIRRVLILLIFAMLFFVVLAFALLLLGFQRYYLFEGGVVRWANGLLRVLPWRDVACVEPMSALGLHTGYKLHPTTGRPLVIATPRGKSDEMARRLEARLRAARLF
jgi:hypothetical protein